MATDEDRKRTRSPAYPFVDLKEAIHYAKLAYEEDGQHPFTPEAAAAHWGYKATSSAVNQILSALKQFGLLVLEPGTDSRRVRLSEAALDLLVREDENDPRRRELLKAAALSPKLHREIWDEYKGRLPSDATLRIYLLRDREGAPFNKDQVDRFISQLKETIAFANLVESDKLPPDDDEKAKSDSPPGSGEVSRQPSDRERRRHSVQPGTVEAVYPLDGGKAVVITWPDNIDPGELEDVEDWMGMMFRKIKRAAERNRDDGGSSKVNLNYADAKDRLRSREQFQDEEQKDDSSR